MQYIDKPYSRLNHDLQDLSQLMLLQGYSLCKAALGDFAEHINSCYDGIGITETELQSHTTRPVCNAELWLAVKDDQIGSIIATDVNNRPEVILIELKTN